MQAVRQLLLLHVQEATADDIRLLATAFKVRAELDGHAAHSAVFYLLMTVPSHAMQGVRHHHALQ